MSRVVGHHQLAVTHQAQGLMTMMMLHQLTVGMMLASVTNNWS